MIPDEIVTGDREAKRLLCYAAAPEGPPLAVGSKADGDEVVEG